MPRVSVVIPVYNGRATVAAAIASVLAQSFRDFELIAVDDGSTDDSARELERYADHIRVIRQANGGIAKARNAGLRVAQGEYVGLLDCDDAWEPAMLEETVRALDADPHAVLAYTNVAVTDSTGRPLASALIGPETAHAPSLDEMLGRLWPIMPSAVVARRRALETVGGFCEEFRGLGYEDAYCWMRLRELGPFHYIAAPLVRWRFSPYPQPLKKFGAHPEAARTFARLLRERWGRDATPLLRARARASRSILAYIGLRELRDGNRDAARAAFRRALWHDPWRVKNYLRLARTYLPSAVARALGGRTAGAARGGASVGGT
ncbi:MAG TPA: glycosyltransferase family A protein [Candidatus Binataceae bacterium]|nr:glycosyltransferase family A protein [Candidatus Binataceae bacterium]